MSSLTYSRHIRSSVCCFDVPLSVVVVVVVVVQVADLKISKTGKHGSSKANMVGYDIITNKKYQETVPGHTMMFGFTPVKVEYEVADIHDGQITGMTPDGQEKFFNVPEDPEVGEKLVNEFTENAAKGGDQFWIITVVYAPRMVGKK